MNKPAVLLVEYATGKVDTFPGEKGDIYTNARELIREINDKGNPEGIARVIAFGMDGVIKDKKWKGLTPAPVAEKPAESEQSEDEVDEADELAKRVRADLKAKGVKVPPRISVEKLMDLASEHGVEV